MKANRSVFGAILALALLCSVFGAGYGQNLTGQLTGTVTDPSGAVVPNANITLKNQLSGDIRRTVSNSEGVFAFASVPTGEYTITIESQGFAKWERAGIKVSAGDRRSVSDIALSTTAVSGTVDISATADQVAPVDNGEKSVTLSNKQIQNLSLVGRSAAELIKALPGFTPITNLDNKPRFNGEAIGINGNGDGGQQSAIGNFSANGTRAEALDIVADGSHVSDPGCNCATPININPEMVEEFKVSTSNFGADVSKGPVVLTAISKGGGREFHGSAYLYARHFAMNANDWSFNKNSQPRPENRYFFPGGNIGGPVLIPGTNFNKSREKLFFFFGFEAYRQRLDTGLLQSRVPTEAMRNGDFSDAAYLAKLGSAQVKNLPAANATNGLTGITGGRIPTSLIDPTGRALMNLLPLPNVDPASNSSGFNYIQAIQLDQNMKQTLTRVDYNISEKTKFFARYNLQTELQQFPVGLWWRNPSQVPYPTPVEAPNRSDSVSASLTQIFTPTLTNEVVFGYSYIDFPNQFKDPQKVSKSALNIPFRGLFKNGLDQIPSVTSWGEGPTLFNPGGFDPVLFATKHLLNFSDNLTMVKGTHTLKFGAYFEHLINNQPGNDNSNGLAVFNAGANNSSGNVLADLLLGRLSDYQESTKNVLHNIGFNTFEFYAADSWKASRKLTLDLGARFYHLGKWYDRQGFGFAVFDASKFNAADAAAGRLPGVSWQDRDGGVPLSGAPTKALFAAPRLGVAYDLFGDGYTVLRGGFGRSYYHDAQLTSGLDIAAGARRVGSTGNTSFAALDARQATADLITSFEALDPNDDKQPYVDSFSFTVQQRLPYKMTLETAYVGNRSRDQLYTADQNVVPLNTAGCRAAAVAGGNCDAFRPFQGYGAVNLVRHIAFQNYNSLQMTLSRQTGRVNYLASYTFSKALGIRNGGLQGSQADVLDLRGHNYGILGYDRTHVFNVAYTVEAPNFAKDYLKTNNKFARGALDGWTLSGISQFASGFPLQADNVNFRLSGSLEQTCGFAKNNPATAGLCAGKADTDKVTIYNPSNVASVLGTPNTSAQPILTCDPRSGLGKDQFANLNCFAPPAPGQSGAYVFPYLKGPAYNTHDLTLSKNFAITESKRLQFRISANNFLNHPLKSLVGDNLNLQYTTDNPDSANPKLVPNDFTKTNFGKYTENKFGRRVITLGAKFTF